jgi:hypothetical protein
LVAAGTPLGKHQLNGGVETRWIGTPPFVRLRQPGCEVRCPQVAYVAGPVPSQASAAALQALLLKSLDRGHRRVALQRYLKLKACQYDVPGHAAAACEAYLQSLPRRELNRMFAAAIDWAEMTGGHLEVGSFRVATRGERKACSA